VSGVAVLGGTSLRGTAPQRAAAALLAGTLAIAVNTALLAAANAIPLVTARGGLLKLLKVAFGDTLARLGADALWTQSGLPAPGSNTFQLGFHVVVGLAMALLYGLALEAWLTGPPWRKGLVYAAAVWLANAFIVLPLLGEGVASSRSLNLAGMAYYAPCRVLLRPGAAKIGRLPATLRDMRSAGPGNSDAKDSTCPVAVRCADSLIPSGLPWLLCCCSRRRQRRLGNRRLARRNRPAPMPRWAACMRRSC